MCVDLYGIKNARAWITIEQKQIAKKNKNWNTKGQTKEKK